MGTDPPTNGTFRYLTHDHLGSTRGVFDGARASLGTFEHTPYGSPYVFSGPGDVTQLFTGHDLDPVTGKYYAPFRYLDPTAGRWLKRDPLRMVNGPNMYGYVGGDLINYVDPFGLRGDEVLDDFLPGGIPNRAGGWVPLAPLMPGGDRGRGAVEAPAAFGNGLVPGNPFGDCINDREPFAEGLGEQILLGAVGGPVIGKGLGLAGKIGRAGMNVVGRGLAGFFKAVGLGSGPRFPIGIGRHGGEKIFRIAGTYVERLTGRRHINMGWLYRKRL